MADKKTCRICGIEKVFDDFAKSSSNKDGHDSRCKQCKHEIYENHKDEVIAKIKDNYFKNRDAILEQKRSAYALRRDVSNERRRKAWNEDPFIKQHNLAYKKDLRIQCIEKLGGKCVGCGITDQTVLCFDHVNDDGQAERASGITKMRVQRKILEGSDQYQLLCFNCNLKKGILKDDKWEPTGSPKRCPTCANNFDTGHFKKDKSYSDGFYYECRKCCRFREIALKVEAMVRVGSIICVHCGIDDVNVLTFDHRNDDGKDTRKLDKVGGTLYRNLTRGIIDSSRFQVLCLNCNIKKHLNPHKITENLTTPVYFHEIPGKPIDQYEKLELGPPIEFDLQNVLVELSSDITSAVVFLNTYHYAGFGRYGSIIIKATINSEIIVILKFASPIRIQVATSAGADFSHTLELDRLCVHPSYHKKNLVSFLLSRAIKIIKQERPDVTHLVSFADPEHGHDGTIYKAANWTEVPSHFRSYEYIDSEGKVHHKKTVYNLAHNRNMKETEYASSIGLKRRHTVKKHKFVYVM